MGKIEKWHLLPSYCRYLDESFIEKFLKSFLSAIYIFADLGHMTKMVARPYMVKPLKKFILQSQWADCNEIYHVASKIRAHHCLFEL